MSIRLSRRGACAHPDEQSALEMMSAEFRPDGPSSEGDGIVDIVCGATVYYKRLYSVIPYPISDLSTVL